LFRIIVILIPWHCFIASVAGSVIHLVGVAECADAVVDEEELISLMDAVTVTNVVIVVVDLKDVGTLEDEDTGELGGSGWSIREILKKTTGDSRSEVSARPARSRLEMAPVL
jgi:uncharacterized membrane protein